MNINNNINCIERIHNTNKITKINQKQLQKKECTNTTQEFIKVMERVQSSEDIRNKRIEKIKEQINNGIYEINHKAVAEKMIQVYMGRTNGRSY